jgi:FkbM family methyltransferase
MFSLVYGHDMKISKYLPNSLLSRILKILSLRYLIKCDVTRFEIIRSIITNQNIEKKGYTLSNYGVWMLSNYLDRTFQLSILGYRNTLEKILLSVNNKLIFMDIGSNQGVFSLIASKNKNFIEIHAFEPNLNVITYLESNFNRNKVDNFTIHKVAIGSRTGSVPFLALESHSGTGRLNAETSNMHVTGANRDYLDKVFAKCEKSYFIKIDVEGGEHDVLKELFNSRIKLNIKYIFIEIDLEFSQEDVLIATLRSNGFYEVKRIGSKVHYDALYVR